MTRGAKARALKERLMVEKCSTCDGSGQELGQGLFLVACKVCAGTGRNRQRCAQCWKWKSPSEFVGRKGGIVRACEGCRTKYSNWGSRSLEERATAASPRKGLVTNGPLRVGFVLSSGNRKTGPIPVSMTSAGTCPKTCEFYNNGCFAEQHMTGIHWRKVSSGGGFSWLEFCLMVARLPNGQIWRHNEAGDLPGDGERINGRELAVLANANRGKRGFTYTHYPLRAVGARGIRDSGANFFLEHNPIDAAENLRMVKRAIEDGFAINVSTGTLEEADRAADMGLPATIVLPLDAPERGLRTPAGRVVVICPAERFERVSCETCGLCAVTTRKSVVGFRAHGLRKHQITERKRQLPLFQGSER